MLQVLLIGCIAEISVSVADDFLPHHYAVRHVIRDL